MGILVEEEIFYNNFEQYETLIKTLILTKVSKEAYPLQTTTNIINNIYIVDIVFEVNIAVYKLANNNISSKNYLEMFKLLKCILIDTGCSKSLIKWVSILHGLHNKNCKPKSTIWWTNGGYF